MQEDVPFDSVKPTDARAPVLVPRRRPGPVTLAALILSAEVALGLLAGAALLIAATTVPAAFANRAIDAAGVGRAGSSDAMANIDAISNAIRAVLLGGAVVTLLLSVAAAALVVPVARGSWSGRLGAFGIALRPDAPRSQAPPTPRSGNGWTGPVRSGRAASPRPRRSVRRTGMPCRRGWLGPLEGLPICKCWATLQSPCCWRYPLCGPIFAAPESSRAMSPVMPERWKWPLVPLWSPVRPPASAPRSRAASPPTGTT